MMTRRSRPARPAPFLVLALLPLTLLGCGRQGKQSGERPDAPRSPSPYSNPADVPHPCPPQPAGLQVGTHDAVLNAASPQLAEWTAMWTQALPGFAPDSLWLVHRGRWSPLARSKYTPMVVGEGADPGDLLALQLLGLRSPDHRYILDVDSYQVIEPYGDSLEIGGEPDSRCSLIDERAGAELVLLQCGTPGGYHWGTWLSPASFAVGGWNDADDFGQWKQGGLWIYSISDSSVTEYTSRIVSAAAYARYEAAWQGWVLRRYRVLKRSRSPV